MNGKTSCRFVCVTLTCSHSSTAIPSQPGTPEATAVGKEHVIIEWQKPESDGGSELKNYIVEKREKNSSRSEQILDSLKMLRHHFLNEDTYPSLS